MNITRPGSPGGPCYPTIPYCPCPPVPPCPQPPQPCTVSIVPVPGPTGATGATGPAGNADTITVRYTNTTEPGTAAAVIDVTGGPNHVLDFNIPRGATGPAGAAGTTGPTGATGATGPAGSSESACCGCAEQMRNIIQQIIALYPNNDFFVTLDSGDASLGRPGSLILGPYGRTGVFEMATPLRQYLPICNIDSIQINNAAYNDAIIYLPEPVPAPTDCCADCETTVRSLLPVGTPNASIITNTQTPSNGTVIKNEYGMIVLANEASNNITFISSCSIDRFYFLV